MNKLNESINQASLELDKVMPKFLEKYEEVKKILSKNCTKNPVKINSKDDKFICDTADEWFDLCLAWPLIHYRNPELFFYINELFCSEQPPMFLVAESCKKILESKGE
jgi:hypothetical protein